MSQRIPQSFIDDLLARADISELIGSRVTLKHAGREHKGLCPFHDEKTPSFTVSATKGFYHCFGCGAHGTAIGFLMNYDNLGFPEAVEALADRLGLEVPKEIRFEELPGETDLRALLREADQIFRRLLRESPAALDYLQKRGIDGKTAARFGIGYAPDAWDTILRELGGSEDRVGKLVEAGLLIRNDQGRCYDRFRHRIMFPIRDPRGAVIGFGGRVLDSGEPKYLNSPETPVFHKGRSLYGLHEARQKPGRPTEVVVVEGYLDTVSLAQFGVEPVVATLGTATTVEHVRLLTRMTDRIIFCFDGDRAGRAAAWRALETALPLAGGQIEIKFLLLPSGEDPDSWVRSQGAEAFRALAAEALPLSELLVEELSARSEPEHADGRAKLVSLARPLLAKVPRGSVYRELLIASLADRIGFDAGHFSSLVEAGEAESTQPAAKRREAAAGGQTRPAAGAHQRNGADRSPRIRHAIKLILHYPAVGRRADAVPGLESVASPGAVLLRQLLEIVKENPNICHTSQLLERFRGHDNEEPLQRLAAAALLDDEAAAAGVLHDNLALIVQDHERRQRGEALRRGNNRPEI